MNFLEGKVKDIINSSGHIQDGEVEELSVPSIVNVGNGVAAESIIDMMSVSHLSVKVSLMASISSENNSSPMAFLILVWFLNANLIFLLIDYLGALVGKFAKFPIIDNFIVVLLQVVQHCCMVAVNIP